MTTGRIRPVLRDCIAIAAAQLGATAEDVDVIETSDARFGHYQTNIAFRLAKRLRKNPMRIAERIAEALDTDGMCQLPEIAGGGFINLRLDTDWIARQITLFVSDRRLCISPVSSVGRCVVDFSSPNVAKRMHVGHLRSTIIGDALIRTLRFLGHEVLGDNHVGDWGTQFGILIWAWKELRDDEAMRTDPIGELERLYKLGTEHAEADAVVADRCRAELAALQRGEPENVALWERFVEISRLDAEELYARLGIQFDLWLGESTYNDLVPSTLKRLSENGLTRNSRGALVVFFDEPALQQSPFMVQKSDGAYLYSTTDIATIVYRVDTLRADRIIYVVDARQTLHFRQLFATARALGYGSVSLVHVGFGMMLGSDGKPFRTRTGGTVSLKALLDEAEERILPIVEERWPAVSEEERRRIASAVGIGAIKYSDLAHNLANDYEFNWERMLSAEGNTGPYLQYTLVRIRSLLRNREQRDRGGVEMPSREQVLLLQQEEQELAINLVQFGDALDRTALILRPHVLCEFLYAVARSFNAFYAVCLILDAVPAEVRESRVCLTAVTGRVLEIGLSCLNIAQLDKM